MHKRTLPSVTSPALSAFAEVADEFCRLIERHKTLERAQFLVAVHHLLPRLYSAAIALPLTSILFSNDSGTSADSSPTEANDSDSEASHDRLSTDDATALCRSLGVLIGEPGFYREIYDPFEPLTEPEVAGLLADDFADIYRDLDHGRRKWRRGESGEALWEWRFNFEQHWGEHLTGALRALYILAARYEFIWPDEGRTRVG